MNASSGVEPQRDIILILGGGGMMGIFTAGILKALEPHRDRIAAIYATSASANPAIYFIAGQSDVPPPFFMDYLTKPEFIRRNVFSYIYKVFFLKGKSTRIPDFIDIDWYIPAAQAYRPLNFQALERSPIDFFVKVLDIDATKTSYMPAKKDPAQKLMAASQCGPFSTKIVTIEGRRYIDGGTLISPLDAELARENPDKHIIYVQPAGPQFLYKALLYPCYVLAAAALGRLYGSAIGWRFLKELFSDELPLVATFPNVTVIENDFQYSSFCTDKNKLHRVYEHSLTKGSQVAQSL